MEFYCTFLGLFSKKETFMCSMCLFLSAYPQQFLGVRMTVECVLIKSNVNVRKTGRWNLYFWQQLHQNMGNREVSDVILGEGIAFAYKYRLVKVNWIKIYESIGFCMQT